VFRALRSLAPDYSKAEYDLKWSADVWWNKDVIVYGDASLKKDHPVVAFLAADK
jgi:dual specificity MAP kinase phosphatase